MRRPEQIADADRPRRRGGRGARAAALALSAAGHLAVPLALVLLWRPGPPAWSPSDEEPISLSLVQPPPPPPPEPEPETPAPVKTPDPEPAKPAPAKPAPPKPAAPPERPRPRPTPPPPIPVQTAPLTPGPSVDRIAELDEAALAGAVTAESGAGSGSGAGAGEGGAPCNMVRRLQAALRRDPEVRAAVAEARRRGTGKAMLLWDGDWIRDPAQDGKGLAGLRQAIVMEVAFAPEACRADPLRGPVVISMGDGPGAARLALGRGPWRWSDLLGRQARSGGAFRR